MEAPSWWVGQLFVSGLIRVHTKNYQLATGLANNVIGGWFIKER